MFLHIKIKCFRSPSFIFKKLKTLTLSKVLWGKFRRIMFPCKGKFDQNQRKWRILDGHCHCLPPLHKLSHLNCLELEFQHSKWICWFHQLLKFKEEDLKLYFLICKNDPLLLNLQFSTNMTRLMFLHFLLKFQIQFQYQRFWKQYCQLEISKCFSKLLVSPPFLKCDQV